MPPHEYKTEEDPRLFQSIKTHRGPLSDNWIEEYKRRLLPVMCAYKLCKVEFRYWGMQSKIERFIHDTGACACLSSPCFPLVSERGPRASPLPGLSWPTLAGRPWGWQPFLCSPLGGPGCTLQLQLCLHC